jgi:Rrf2 family nitric oxide-sensitive transcriptional repressor
MERGMELVECFGSDCNCILDPSCKLKVALSDALAAFLKVLDGVTLTDLLGRSEHAILRFLPQTAASRS